MTEPTTTTEVELAVSSVDTKAWNRVQNFVPDLKKQFVDNAISLLKEQGHSLAESEEVRQEAMRHVTENILGEVYYISFREEKEDD